MVSILHNFIWLRNLGVSNAFSCISGEPFIDGQAVPYDPKYHEHWKGYTGHTYGRSRRNNRPRSFESRGAAPPSYQPPPTNSDF
jgi:hypothetical protein